MPDNDAIEQPADFLPDELDASGGEELPDNEPMTPVTPS